MFRCVLFGVGAFETILVLQKLDAKRAKMVMQKFVPQNFCNECSWSTPLDPKLMFWCIFFRLGAFGIVSLLHKTRSKTRHTVAINAKVSVPKSCQNFFAMNAPDPHHWTLNSCLGAFYLFWVLLRPFWYCKNSMQNRQKWWCKSSWYEVMSEFFATNVPDPHHWTLNSRFGEFLSVWVHLGLFLYCTKLGAKRVKMVQLMQKFVVRSHVESFHNQCSQSTKFDPKLMFWCVSLRLGEFGTVSLLRETRCKTRQNVVINAKFRGMKSCLNFSQRTFPIHTIRP